MFGLLAGLPIVLWDMNHHWSNVIVVGDNWYEGLSWIGSLKGGVEQFYGSFFEGFDGLTWFVVFLQVTGGLLGG